MNLPQVISLGAALVGAYTLGRIRGEYVGVRLVINNIRTLGRHFTAREVVIGCAIPWTTHMEVEAKASAKATLDAEAPRRADPKREAEVLVSGIQGYRHPFLHAESHDA